MKEKKIKATLLNYYGSDRSIAERSWVSTNKAENRSDEEVARVLKFMVYNSHTKPMETVVFSFRIECDLATDRQLATYRMVTGSTAHSLRYCDADTEVYVPEEIQGDSRLLYIDSVNNSLLKYDEIYNQLMLDGVPLRRAREIARRVLPLGIMTKRELDFNLVSLAHFFKQRLDPHAEKEIQYLAHIMKDQIMFIRELSEITKLLDSRGWCL